MLEEKQIKDTKLYDLVKGMLKSILSNFNKEIINELPEKTIIYYKPEYQSGKNNKNGSLVISEIIEKKKEFLSLVFSNEIKENSEIKKLINYLQEKFNNQTHSNSWTNFLLNYLDIDQSFEFNQMNFGLIYSYYEDYLFKRLTPVRILTIIPNLSIESDKISLTENDSLIKLADDDFNLIYSLTIEKNYLMNLLVPSYGCVFEQKIIVNDYYDIPSEKNHREFLLTSLKLFKQGDIMILNSVNINNNPFYGTTTIGINDRMPLFNLKNKYIISKKEETEFIAFYNKIKRHLIDFSNFIRLALSRFEGTWLRKTNDDKLVDLIIALEALYLQKGSGNSNRLALYISWFIGADFKDRKNIYKFIRDTYRYRNHIVHGSSEKYSNKIRNDLPGAINTLKELFRKSFAKLLNIEYHKKEKLQFIRLLEDLILGE